MMQRFVALYSLFICMVCFGQDQPFIDKDEVSYSESSVILDSSFGPGSEERSTLREIKSVEYLHIEGLLIKVSRVTQTYSGIEGDRCRSKIVAFEKVGGKYSKSWEITDTSCAAELHRDFLKTIYYGCCGAEDVYSFYSTKPADKNT
ncbi:MAG: hypothetical protein JXR49_08195 [Acidobacteria bacterium]|nr:hypothetical protein [Acidobacteriota bacterium]